MTRNKNMGRFRHVALISACVALCFPASAWGDSTEFEIGQMFNEMRAMVGKPLLEQTIKFSNERYFTLGALTPEGSRFFVGGYGKTPGESVDDMRQKHSVVVVMTPCPSVHDLSAKIASVALWQTLDGDGQIKNSPHIGLGLEQLLAMMNTPEGVVTPSTLRVPRVRNLHGPVFEYVRGDITETLSFVNEGPATRINWTSSNTGICPR